MADSGSLRQAFDAELDQLGLQVEVMGLLVDANLERMRRMLCDGDIAGVPVALAADDEIDAMAVSLTEQCYDVLRREAPVATDLRVVVSVLRVISELERIGDLCLRVLKVAPDLTLLRSCTPTYSLLESMAEVVIRQYREALAAWADRDLTRANQVASVSAEIELHVAQLLREIVGLEGPDAALLAIRTFEAGRALERIADHAAIVTARLRYLLTGDTRHLTAEVR